MLTSSFRSYRGGKRLQGDHSDMQKCQDAYLKMGKRINYTTYEYGLLRVGYLISVGPEIQASD